MRLVPLILILAAAHFGGALDIAAETAKAQMQRNPLLAPLSEISEDVQTLADAVSAIYGRLNELISLELDESNLGTEEAALSNMLSYRQTMLDSPFPTVCSTEEEMLQRIFAKIDEGFNLGVVATRQELAQLLKSFLLDLMTEVQGLLAENLACQFQSEIVKESKDSTFKYFLGIFTQTQALLLDRIVEWSDRRNLQVEDELQTVTNVLLSFQGLYVQERLNPVNHVTSLLKDSTRAVKNEMLLLLFKATEEGELEEIGRRLDSLAEVVTGPLEVAPEEDTLAQIYIVAASLQHHFPSPAFQSFVQPFIGRFLKLFYQSGHQLRAIRLLSNLAHRKLDKKVQSIEHQVILNAVVRSFTLPSDLAGDEEQSDLQKLRILDLLAYLDPQDVPEATFLFVVDNLPAIFGVLDSAVVAHNLPKVAFSETLLPVRSHLNYYQALYEVSLQTATKYSFRNEEAWPVLMDGLIDQALDDGRITPAFYLIMKVHIALYLPASYTGKVVFRRFTLTEPIFAGDRFHHFRIILFSIFRKKNKPTVPPSHQEVCQFFSGVELKPSDFAFLKVNYQTLELTQEEIKDTAKTNQVIYAIQQFAPVLEKKTSEPSSPLLLSEKSVSSESNTPLMGNLVRVLGGILPQQDLENLQRMDFLDWVKGRPLRMIEGDIEHHYIIVQRIRSTAVCRNVVLN